ncbi:hypothetical protein GF324_12200 [bacterium]|nr:hypothetical protein [bacterium]
MGGLAKRATMMDRLDPDGTALRFDTGNLVSEISVEEDFAAIADIYDHLDYDAVVPGVGDSVLYLSDSVWSHRIPWLSDEGPYLYEWPGGVIRLQAFSSYWLPESMAAEADTVTEPAREDDDTLRVWLANMDRGELKLLLDRMPNPDVVFLGPSDYIAPSPDTLQQTLVLSTGDEGMDLLSVKIERNGNGGFRVHPSWHNLDPDVPEDPVVKGMIEAGSTDDSR